MSVSFASSETKKNLLRAFAGESQARNRYTISAGIAKKNGLHVIEAVFLFTADQERAHAKAFYEKLGPFAGENLTIEGNYPLDLYPTVLEHLKAAAHNEYQEFEHDYTGFAHVAKEEGFPEISHLFSQIARIEQVHGDRFARFAQLLEEDRLFINEKECQWMCLNCGYLVTATRPPAQCWVCGHDQGWFIRVELTPFTSEKQLTRDVI